MLGFKVYRCPYCGLEGAPHADTCPRIKAIEYHLGGGIKRVELHEPKQPENAIPPHLGEIGRAHSNRKQAVLAGYDGTPCPLCGSMKYISSRIAGTWTCEACGATSRQEGQENWESRAKANAQETASLTKEARDQDAIHVAKMRTAGWAHCGVPHHDMECFECGVRLYGQRVADVCRYKAASDPMEKSTCAYCGIRYGDRHVSTGCHHKFVQRTRAEVLELRNRAQMGGCCNRFAEHSGCTCLEDALP